MGPTPRSRGRGPSVRVGASGWRLWQGRPAGARRSSRRAYAVPLTSDCGPGVQRGGWKMGEGEVRGSAKGSARGRSSTCGGAGRQAGWPGCRSWGARRGAALGGATGTGSFREQWGPWQGAGEAKGAGRSPLKAAGSSRGTTTAWSPQPARAAPGADTTATSSARSRLARGGRGRQGFRSRCMVRTPDVRTNGARRDFYL